MPTLYYHPLSSYCHKVLVALHEHRVDFERRIIDLGKQEDREALAAVWPPTKFPVLLDEKRQLAIPESSIIIEYLDRFYRGQGRLIPEEFGEALEVRLWDRFFDSHVHTPVQQIVLDRIMGRKGDMGSQRAALTLAYGMIEERMAQRTWVAGSQWSLADCAAVPALFYATTLVPIPPEHQNALAYFERLMERPSVKSVIEQAQPYFGMYPFHESIPARFLA